MLFWNRSPGCLGAVLLGLLLGGCSLSNDSQQDDENEPHFVLGKSRVNAMDYTGAVEAFKEALEVSPHSAAAHYQLAWLFENELKDPAAAIYHYQEYLDLSPKAGNRDVIKQHVYTCKQQLVADVMQLPSAPAVQRQIDKLTAENQRMQDELTKWHTYYAAEQAAHNNPTPPAGIPTSGQPPAAANTTGGITTATRSATPVLPTVVPMPPMPKFRTHTVASGETLATIARKAGVSLPALQDANPGLNPRKLRSGQVINLPSP